MYNDVITKKAVIDIIEQLPHWILNADGEFELVDATTVAMIDPKDAISAILTAPPAFQWTPIKWHKNIDTIVYDCEMPKDGQEILITTKTGKIETDICYIYNNEYFFESCWPIEDIIAWMPLPLPVPYEER